MTNSGSNEGWASCQCSNCGRTLEYNQAQTNEVIQCPHCLKNTLLYVPMSQQPYVAGAPPVISPHEVIATTGNDFVGFTVEAYLGVVRGVVVRSPDILQGVLGGLKSIVGGNIETYAEVCEETRRQAFERMVQHARQVNANGIIAVRYDATEFSPGITEVLAYGTAVRLNPRAK